jgi:rhodanese-related sulfurtransferase
MYPSALVAAMIMLLILAPLPAAAAELSPRILVASAACAPPQECVSGEAVFPKEKPRQPGSSSPEQRAEDTSLFISAGEVLRLDTEGRVLTLVDVRSTRDFNTFRIPGSLSLPLSTLWTRGFLKSRRVVLVHGGHRCEPLLQACRNLRAAGFDVAILAGGLPQWRRSGGPLEGDAVAIKEMTWVSPRTFHEAQKDGQWIVVDASSGADTGRAMLPQSRRVSLAAGPAAFQAELTKMARDQGGDPCLRVLLVTERGEYPEDLQRVAEQAVTVDVFYLEGGLAAHRDYLETQVRMWQPKPARDSMRKRCGSCP